MIVKAEKNFRHQISKGTEYQVLEIIIKRNSNVISYRIVDNDSIPAIYENSLFSVVSNYMENASVIFDDAQIVMSHKLITDSKLNQTHTEGFWGAFFEDDPVAMRILEEVIVGGHE